MAKRQLRQRLYSADGVTVAEKQIASIRTFQYLLRAGVNQNTLTVVASSLLKPSAFKNPPLGEDLLTSDAADELTLGECAELSEVEAQAKMGGSSAPNAFSVMTLDAREVSVILGSISRHPFLFRADTVSTLFGIPGVKWKLSGSNQSYLNEALGGAETWIPDFLQDVMDHLPDGCGLPIPVFLAMRARSDIFNDQVILDFLQRAIALPGKEGLLAYLVRKKINDVAYLPVFRWIWGSSPVGIAAMIPTLGDAMSEILQRVYGSHHGLNLVRELLACLLNRHADDEPSLYWIFVETGSLGGAVQTWVLGKIIATGRCTFREDRGNLWGVAFLNTIDPGIIKMALEHNLCSFDDPESGAWIEEKRRDGRSVWVDYITGIIDEWMSVKPARR